MNKFFGANLNPRTNFRARMVREVTLKPRRSKFKSLLGHEISSVILASYKFSVSPTSQGIIAGEEA